MATTFSIKKTKKGYCVIQKTKNVYTGKKTKISNLGLAYITKPDISTDEHESSSRAIECEVRDKYPCL